MVEKNRKANDVLERHGEARVHSENLYLQYHTAEEIEEQTMGLLKKKKIQAARKLLKEKGFLTEHRNPEARLKFDNTVHYRLDTVSINTAISSIGSESPHGTGQTDRPPGQTTRPSGQTTRTITETNTGVNNKEEKDLMFLAGGEEFKTFFNRAWSPDDAEMLTTCNPEELEDDLETIAPNKGGLRIDKAKELLTHPVYALFCSIFQTDVSAEKLIPVLSRLRNKTLSCEDLLLAALAVQYHLVEPPESVMELLEGLTGSEKPYRAVCAAKLTGLVNDYIWQRHIIQNYDTDLAISYDVCAKFGQFLDCNVLTKSTVESLSGNDDISYDDHKVGMYALVAATEGGRLNADSVSAWVQGVDADMELSGTYRPLFFSNFSSRTLRCFHRFDPCISF